GLARAKAPDPASRGYERGPDAGDRVPAFGFLGDARTLAQEQGDRRSCRRQGIGGRDVGLAMDEHSADPGRVRVLEQIRDRLAVERLVFVMGAHGRRAGLADDVRLAQRRSPVGVVWVVVVNMDVVEIDDVLVLADVGIWI